MSCFRDHMTYANVMATLAVFLVLGAAGAWDSCNRVRLPQPASGVVA